MLTVIAASLPTIVWTLLSGILWTIGDLTMRSWIETKWPYGFEVSLLICMVGVFCVMMSCFQQNIAIATLSAIVVNVIGYLIGAFLIFGDILSITQGIGIFLGLLSVSILELA